MNYKILYVLTLCFWDLISPIVSTIRQTGDGNNIFNEIYYYYIFFVVLFSIYILQRRSTIRSMQIKYLLGLFIILFCGTLENVYLGKFEFKFFVGQAASWVLFLVIFLSYEEKFDDVFDLLMARILWFNILFNFVSAIMFRLEFFGGNSYFTFDISGVLLTVAYLAKFPKKIPLLMTVISSLIAMKRSILIVIVVLWLLTRRHFAFLRIKIVVRLFKYLFTLMLIGAMYLISDIDLILITDLSLAERLLEVKNSFMLFDSYTKFIWGNGLGWSFPIFSNDPSDYDLRGFTHITPVYLIVSLGLFGVLAIHLLYMKIFAGEIRHKKYSALMIFGILSLIMSFSRLNIFTDPIVALSVSSLLLNKKERHW